MISDLYYLHVNGDLIHKNNLEGTAADIRESDFAVGLWFLDKSDRASAWHLLIEALASGANEERIDELAAKWHCNDEDAEIYSEHYPVNLSVDGNQKCATSEDFVNLQESPAGFGDTYLEAMAELCKGLGYKPAKIWGMTFEGLLNGSIHN